MFPGHGAALSQTWRSKQLEYTWLRTLSGQYRDFWTVTGDALSYSVSALRLPATEAQQSRLLDAYLTLQPFPENLDVLTRLHGSGLVLGTLSNGTARMLDAALASAGMAEMFSYVLSVDRIGRYKTDPAAHREPTRSERRRARSPLSRRTAGMPTGHPGTAIGRSGSIVQAHRWIGSARRRRQPGLRSPISFRSWTDVTLAMNGNEPGQGSERRNGTFRRERCQDLHGYQHGFELRYPTLSLQ
jgi:2-haloalkanoic acid dehalogenase type II